MKKMLLVMLLALPAMAMAGTIMPGGDKNAWDIYTMGNGAVIVQILQATIAIVGNSGYRTLLLLVAVGGFLFLAIQAGFDFGKNFMRMFTYIFVVWLVVHTSSTLTINAQVDDEVTHSYQGVANVPAVVGLPAAMITGIGHWLSQNIATAFGVDPMLSVSGGTGGNSGGGFNIFGDMMEDANNFVITSPELKNSLAAFMGDCVVSELGLQFLTPTALNTSSNLWATIGKTLPQGVMTRYYYPSSDGSTPPSSMSCPGSSESFSPAATGAILSCPAAYSCLTQDLANHAQGLLDAKQAQWASTGAVAPYNGAFQAAIAAASGGNSNGGAITPQALVQQEALINEMHGAFRHAAVATGDNSLLINANVASAEQQQKSAFYVGSLVTEHMAGYIFTVLQAFLFAIVPIIIVAALIPGLGRQVAISYIQMLVWLALWEPMYEIVNFLVLAFSHQSVGVTFSSWNGPTMGNQFTMSEQTSNLVAAARMLGSSVPILALGLVKGGIALEKFAADALGSQFANSAGTQAGLGGFNEAGVSLSTVKGNSYNTASESVVGASETRANMGNGALLGNVALGGEMGTLNGKEIGTGYSAQNQISGNKSISQDANLGQTGAQNIAAGNRSDNTLRNDYSRGTGTNESSSTNTTLQNTGSKGQGTDKRHDVGQQQNLQHNTSHDESSDNTARANGGLKDGGGFGPAKMQGPQQVQIVGDNGATTAAHSGAPGATVGAPGAAPGAAPAAGGSVKSTNNGLMGDLGFQGSSGISSGSKNSVGANSTESAGNSSSYSSSVSMQQSLSHGSSYAAGTSANSGHTMSNGASHGYNADHNSTYSNQSGISAKASETQQSSESVTKTTSVSGGFQQGQLSNYLGETHAFQDGYWDTQSAAMDIKNEFLSGLAAQHLSVDQWKASAGPDFAAAHGGAADPGPLAGPGGQPAVAVPGFATPSGLTAGYASLAAEAGQTQRSVDKRTSILDSGVSSTQGLLTKASTDPLFSGVHFEASPAAANGIFVSPGASTADTFALTGLGAGAASIAISRHRSGVANDMASRMANKVSNP